MKVSSKNRYVETYLDHSDSGAKAVPKRTSEHQCNPNMEFNGSVAAEASQGLYLLLTCP